MTASGPSRLALVTALLLGGAACSSNRQVLAGPEPKVFSDYLQSAHPSDIQVTDRRGGTHWFHHPVVDGDTLRGVRNNELPQPRLAIAIAEIDHVDEPHFSVIKTVGYYGGFLAAVGLVIVVVAGQTRAVY